MPPGPRTTVQRFGLVKSFIRYYEEADARRSALSLKIFSFGQDDDVGWSGFGFSIIRHKLNTRNYAL